MLPFDELRRTQIHLQENVTAKLSKLATIDTTDSDRACVLAYKAYQRMTKIRDRLSTPL
eukprot:m.806259 g.806259  ORF g.806259 m.806259 type:complete len:59 (+) comp59294_c0_seq23:322-498(+)